MHAKTTQFHTVLSGNAMGYVRMIRSGGLHCCSSAIRYNKRNLSESLYGVSQKELLIYCVNVRLNVILHQKHLYLAIGNIFFFIIASDLSQIWRI